MESVRNEIQIFVRRLGLLNASCCDECCGEQVTMVQSHILFEVRRLGRPSMQQVAEELGMDVTTFSRQAKTLETKEFVSRSISPVDRRVTLLELTVAGSQVLGKIDSYMAVQLGKIFGTMTMFESETVIRSLQLLNGAMAKINEAGAKPGGMIACCK